MNRKYISFIFKKNKTKTNKDTLSNSNTFLIPSCLIDKKRNISSGEKITIYQVYLKIQFQFQGNVNVKVN